MQIYQFAAAQGYGSSGRHTSLLVSRKMKIPLSTGSATAPPTKSLLAAACLLGQRTQSKLELHTVLFMHERQCRCVWLALKGWPQPSSSDRPQLGLQHKAPATG